MKFFDLFKRKKTGVCCARCKKKITEAEAQWIGDHRFCKDCDRPISAQVSRPQHSSNVTANSVRCDMDPEYTEHLITAAQQSAAEAQWIGDHRFCKDCARPVSAQVSRPQHSSNVTANSVRCDMGPEYTEHLITAAQQSAKVEELDHLITITGDGYRSTSLYLHKTTNEPYIVTATLEQHGGGYIEHYHSIEKATSSYIDAISSYKTEHDYAAAYKLKSIFIDYKKIGRSFSIGNHRFTYMAYLRIHGIEVPVKEAMLSKDKVRIPAEYLSSEEYAQYLVYPGPYEHEYDLPSELIDNVVVRIIHIPGGDA